MSRLAERCEVIFGTQYIGCRYMYLMFRRLWVLTDGIGLEEQSGPPQPTLTLDTFSRVEAYHGDISKPPKLPKSPLKLCSMFSPEYEASPLMTCPTKRLVVHLRNLFLAPRWLGRLVKIAWSKLLYH
ncbi:uncharacterized protein CLUP02_03092 [Colletotrichum lupini]|uniref:Uncharacterized protein n=1 Tax=Colletotrichum lupini TaxID=145971 RepID=A0A9Q8SI78_9PEZI|nr:uncharacterized protein CLUP02_03092 [Colletotrichum lupini]UQC77623.1 hypothetical protein CLUP02_03092 [Colletotrichum lupini]